MKRLTGILFVLFIIIGCESKYYKIPKEFSGNLEIFLGADISSIKDTYYDNSTENYLIYFDNPALFDRAIIVTEEIFSNKISMIIFIKDLKAEDNKYLFYKNKIALLCNKKFGICNEYTQNLEADIEYGYYAWYIQDKVKINLSIPNSNKKVDYSGRKFPLNISLCFKF